VNRPEIYTEAEVAQAAAAIGGCLGGTDEDMLIDVLFLGALASFLDLKYVAASSRWTTDNQEILLALRSEGSTFDQIIEHVALPMLRATWLTRFFHGAHPGLHDPKNALIELMGSLEELSMTATVDCCFAVLAYRETPLNRRAKLLAALAETSREERRWNPTED
jgi:hypothetical protein